MLKLILGRRIGIMRVWDIKDNKVLHTDIDGLGSLSSTLSMRDRNTLVYEKLDDEIEKRNDRSRIKTPNTRNDDLADKEINVNGGTSHKIIKHLDSRRTQEGCVSGCKQDRQEVDTHGEIFLLGKHILPIP